MAAPITLSRQQFLKTAVGSQPGANYGHYLSYIAKARGGTPAGQQAAPAAPADPYTGIIKGLPQPLTPAQIQTQAQGQISPLVAAITAQVGKQTQAASDAIRGYTADEASKLAAMNFASPYTTGEQGQAAVDAALQQSLAGAGSSDAAALSQRLGVINDPSVAAAAGTVGANGAANGNTQLAQGSAALGNLIANAAAASDYGQKQPGIAKLAGLQNIAGVEQTGQNNIATQTQALEQQLPSIIQALTGENDSRTSALTAARENQIARQDALASGAATIAEKAGATDQSNQTKLQIAKLNAQGKASAAEISAARSDRSYRLAYAKAMGYDPVTGKTLPGFTRNAAGNVVKTSTTAGKGLAGSKLTANEVPALVQKWHDGKPTSVTVELPKTDANGNPVYRTKHVAAGQVNYQQAYKYLRASGMADQAARTALDTVYTRGDQGRAWLTNEEQAALKQAGRQTTVGRYKGQAFIGPNQVAALRKAGKLPAGELVNGRYFIKPGG